MFQSKLGQFVVSAGAATFGFWVVWPLEVLKVTCTYTVSHMCGYAQGRARQGHIHACAKQPAGPLNPSFPRHKTQQNQVQAGTAVGPRGAQATLLDRVKYLAAGGVGRLYRGILPGTLRSVVSNGCSMVVMIEAQKLVTKMGLRR